MLYESEEVLAVALLKLMSDSDEALNLAADGQCLGPAKYDAAVSPANCHPLSMKPGEIPNVGRVNEPPLRRSERELVVVR